MTNKEQFAAELEKQYESLFKTDSDYAFSAARTTPKELAIKMMNSLAAGTANKEGKGIARTCKILSIQYTYKAIQEFLTTL